MTVSEILVVGLLAALLALGLILLLRRAPEPNAHQGVAMMADWDRRVRDMPQHADLRLIIDRLVMVEHVVDVIRGELSGVKDTIGRIERLTNLLLQHQMGEGKGA